MKSATMEIDESEILTAIKAYVEKDGWKIEGKITLTRVPGFSDQREGDQREGTHVPDSVKASFKVVPAPRTSGSHYGD